MISESQIIAVVGLLGVFVGALISGFIAFFIASKRNDLEARVEICKYREKWLEQLRHEITEFNTICASTLNRELSSEDKVEFFRHMNKITLLVSDTNEHWPSLHGSMGFLMKDLVTGTDNSELTSDREPFLNIAKKILKEEWNEIQDLLYKKKKKNNAKYK